ncbi:hypothetical protein LXA43DRAFT_889221 [Ganoderma leucocontextum]|nr:hypothetical protein LXA43DRAFT_889221 [Ganoderma leucocontextum]
MEKDEGENFADATERFQDGGGEDTAVRLSARPADARPSLRPRQLALHLHQLSSSTSLLRVLHLCASTLTHLRITYAEYLLTRDRRIYHALASLPHLTSLVIHAIGPRGCAFLKDLKAPLEDVEVEFDDDWVLTAICASLDTPAGNNALVPGFSGDSIGLPTPTATPATSPAAARGDVLVLPDPISLLANSMATLRTLRASNAIIVTVADKLRYPRVKTLALRLASVPTVTPLVHAFPALTELYIYTPFDGCGVRAPVAPCMPADPDPDLESTDSGLALTSSCSASPKRHLRPPMPSIHATRTANRTSQLYSSFPPLACVRGFVPGLYALGLTCGVRLLEIGALTPPSEGTEEARAVRKVLADAKPTSVSLGLGRGWWAEGRMTVQEKDKDKGRVACSARRKRRETETARDALTSIFGGSMADDEVWAGVTDLVLRVEEPGSWNHVTRDILAMLLPLTSTLTTFVLHWDRTSVPFDRIPHDDGYEDPESDISCAVPLSRAEAFARGTAEQNPSLRYALFKIMHDDPVRSPLTPKAHALATAGSACMPVAPPPAPTPTPGLGPSCELRAPLCESRFFRIECSQGWLCLDTLPAGVAEKVMAAEGLSFADRVRY